MQQIWHRFPHSKSGEWGYYEFVIKYHGPMPLPLKASELPYSPRTYKSLGKERFMAQFSAIAKEYGLNHLQHRARTIEELHERIDRGIAAGMIAAGVNEWR